MNQAKKKPSNSKLARVIAVNLFLIVFCLAGAFGGTIAWFNSSVNQEATVGSFQVVAPGGTDFDLYYLDHFNLNPSGTRDGNYNKVAHQFSGYYSETDSAEFVQVEFEDGNPLPRYYRPDGVAITPKEDAASCTSVGEGYVDNGVLKVLSATSPERTFVDGYIRNPMDINQLWPAYKLTYAINITSGDLNTFSLSSFTEVTNQGIVTNSDIEIHLSWATKIYGKAYNVNSLAAGYSTYLTNLTSPDPNDDVLMPINPCFSFNESTQSYAGPFTVSGAPVGTGSQTWLFFTIEFSNDTSTWYSLNESGKYTADSVNGNSNCYKLLSFTSMAFGIS